MAVTHHETRGTVGTIVPIVVFWLACMSWGCGAHVVFPSADDPGPDDWDDDPRSDPWLDDSDVDSRGSNVGTDPSPRPSEGVIHVSAYDNHTCAVRADGTVWCWGSNWSGQLGDGSFDDRSSPVRVAGLNDAVGVACGFGHNCAWLENGDVYCWGQAAQGRLGNGTDVASIPEPVRISSEEDFVVVDVGQSHACGLTSAGGVLCWGGNPVGQLGVGGTSNSLVPVAVEEVDDASELVVGSSHACVIRSDNSLWCWGHNTQGQGGSRESENLHVPTRVEGIHDVAGVAVGSHSTCAWNLDGALFCWGMLVSIYQPEPLPVSGPPAVAGMSVGEVTAYVWTADGSLSIQTGVEASSTGLAASYAEQPFDVEIFDVAAGLWHACALDIDGDLWCWGRNELGEVGNGTRSPVSEPTRIDL